MDNPKKDLISKVSTDLMKTKIELMSRADTVFFTTLVFLLNQEITTDIPTAGVNNKTIYINPEFFASLTKKEQLFLILHEAMHIAYLHMLRSKGKNFLKWNIACDYVINLQLQKAGFTVPQLALINSKYEGMSAEEVYEKLPDDLINPNAFFMEDLSPNLDKMDNTESQDDLDKIKRDMDNILVSAYTAEMERVKTDGSSSSNIPNDLKRYIATLLNPILPWNHLLRKFTNQIVKTDYSWHKPNKRLSQVSYLPSLYSKNINSIMLCIDVSGSICKKQLEDFGRETKGIIKTLKPKYTSLVSFDYCIRVNEKINKNTNISQMNLRGGGGTDISPVIKLTQETKPKLVICFTDGKFRKPNNLPPKNTHWVWIINDNPDFIPPFGKAIYYEEYIK